MWNPFKKKPPQQPLTATTTLEFSNDRPLVSKADDKLNRAPFAERVAGVLRGQPKGSGLVVGIHGPWGDGKTTVLNMLRADLDVDGETATVEFNPWRFTDESSMLAGFFRALAEVVRTKLTTKGELFAGCIETIGRYANVVDDRFGKAGEVAGKIAEASLEELRSRLSKALAEADKRIVVLVDDIDRLNKHETQTLFRLIKACADFPNVSYVLAFDEVAVARSLGEQYGGGDEASGRAFLEKIIQVPLKLPIVMKEDLRLLCFQQLEQAISAAGIELTKEDMGIFVSGFERGISIRLDTPRSAKRYANGLMFALPMLKGEVNIVDLLLAEAVRTFYPAIYNIIRANQAEFSGVESGNDDPRAVALLKQVVEALPAEEQEAIKAVLKGLFPRLSSAYGGTQYGTNWLSPWAKAKRICSPDYCPRYFSYTVPKSDVRDSEMDALFTEAAKKHSSAVSKDIVAYFTGGKAKRVIERMRQHEDSTPPEAVEVLCVAIAANAIHIPNPPSLFSFAEPVSQAGILISHLIRRLPAGEQRVKRAKQVIGAADPLWFGGEVLRWLYVTDDTDKADSNTLTKNEVKEVGKALVERIKTRAAASEPLFSVDVPQELQMLYEWGRAEGREPVQTHLTSVFAKDPKNIALFLQANAPQAFGEDDILPHVGQLDGSRLKNIELIYDLDALAKLIRLHLPGDFDEPQWFPDRCKPVEQRLAEQFIFVHNKLKKEGKPADADGETAGEPNERESTGAIEEDGSDQVAEQADAANQPRVNPEG